MVLANRCPFLSSAEPLATLVHNIEPAIFSHEAKFVDGELNDVFERHSIEMSPAGVVDFLLVQRLFGPTVCMQNNGEPSHIRMHMHV